MSNEKLSSLVKSQLPSFFQEEGENFIAFMEAYYEYMEQQGKLTDTVRNLTSYRDISETTEEFIEYYISSFLPSVPLDAVADKRTLVKYIKYFNQTRGTLASYRLLFRALYNEDIEFSFPADQMLKVSDGEWKIDRYLVSDYDENTYNFIGKTIIGADSGSQALVEDVIRRKVRGRDLMQILVSNIKGEFYNREPVTLLSQYGESGTPHAPIIEAGISGAAIVTAGSYYNVGDVVDLLSLQRGNFAKVVVTATADLGGSLVYSINKGGSGYTAAGETGTKIQFISGDGNPQGNFTIRNDDIIDTFAIAINTNKIGSNTIYSSGAPTVTFPDGSTQPMNTFANVSLAALDYGFPESAEETSTFKDYFDQENAVLAIAAPSDPNITVGDSLFGATTSANAVVTSVLRSYDSTDVLLQVNGYSQFTNSENVTDGSSTVGTATFWANTAGSVVLKVGYDSVNHSIGVGDEIIGLQSGAYGVVKKVLIDTAPTLDYDFDNDSINEWSTYTLKVAANNASNLTSQFTSGPMKRWLEDEGIAKVSAPSVSVGNVVLTSTNSVFENAYTLLRDAFTFKATTMGTIAQLSLQTGGEGYSFAPTIRVRENDIAALGIGEAYLTIQSDDTNWGTGNSSITKVDTTDRIIQSVSGASGDIKAGAAGNDPVAQPVRYANGTYESVVRVWQDSLQRSPGSVNWANNQVVTLKFYDGDYVPFGVDNRTLVATGSAKIVNVQDEGILGENADITASVGADGTITGVRVLDSGFAYQDQEIVLIESRTDRNPGATSAELRLSLSGVANGEGYYASTRGHLDSKRSYIQDSRFYQEFSYEVISPISLDRYRDVALNLVHPAGQALYGKYQAKSNAAVDVTASSENSKKRRASGTISINTGSNTITGSGTSFLSNLSNNGIVTIEVAPREYYQVRLNIVSSDTTANIVGNWSNTSLTGADLFYSSGTI
jgi:hypothetical protein